MEEDTEYLKLPIEDRCQHKLWKARLNGYEAATKLFQETCDEKSPEWGKYLGLVKKFVSDSNAVAQEKGLDAVLAYVENAGCAGKTCGEVMAGIIAKCLGAPKTKTKEKAIEIVMMYVEIERAEIVQDELIKGLSVKTPKVVVACIQCLRVALRDFGSKVITLKPLVKQLPVLLEDRDKGVRDEAKALTVEIYRWAGPAIKPQLASLKPVQLTELEAEFEKLTSEKVAPCRFFRSQQALRAKAAAEQADGDDQAEDEEDEADCAAPVDPYEFMQPVDILSSLPKDFYEKCEAKKWQERKEAMDALAPLTASPKLESGDYGDLVRALRKIISKDSNVMVVALAGKSLAGLAAGLQKRFQQFVGQCVSIVLEKFKEKKQNVVLAMREAIDALFLCTNLEAIQEDVLEALDNKNPSVKSETAAFVARAFSKCDPAALNKKLMKAYCECLLKILKNDPDPTVRDNSAEALGTAMKVVGEKMMTPYLADLEAIKMAKVKECGEKAVVTGPKRKKPKAAGSAPAAPPAAAPRKPEAKALAKPAASSAPAAGRKSRPVSNNKPPPGKSAGKKKPAKAAPQEVMEKELSSEEVDEKAADLLPPEAIAGLTDANWKTRLGAVEQFMNVIRTLSREELPTQVLVRTLLRKPGLKENNFQVLKMKLEVVTFLASNSNLTRLSARYVIDDLAEKIGDAKNGSAAADALTAISEATKLDFVSTQVLDFVFAQKNPKNQSEAMNWLANAIKDFGFLIQVKPIIDNVKKALAATNPAVRTSAITLLGVMYMYMGANLRMLFESEKAALLQQIDAEFEKVQGMVPPPPTRGLSVEAPGDNEDEGREGGSAENAAAALVDRIPRSDISGQITSALLAEMGDKSWKLRLESLQKLAAIINEVKFITPNLGDLPTVFKARMLDSNKNLAAQALNICQTIGIGMGPNCNKYVRLLAPSMISCLGDSKNTVRVAATSCLNSWVEQCGITPFVEGDMLSEALKLENPTMRAELYGWLTEQLPQVKSSSVPTADLALCIPFLCAALEDRNGDVRKKAQDAVLPFMIHLGYEQMARTASKLKPNSKTQVMAALDKAKPSLPAKLPPPNNSKAVRGGGGNKANMQSSPSPTSGANNSFEECGSDASAGSRQASASSKGKMNRAVSKTRLNVKANSTGKKKDEDIDLSPPIVANNLKEHRISDEQKLKVLRWNFVTPRDEFYELLKEQMTVAGFNRNFLFQLFHNDFKFHLKAIDTYLECLESCPEATLANLDLALKWLALRFFDTNPSVLLKGLEYLQGLFQLLHASHYHLHDYEATSFIPYLILKVGDSKDAVRQSVRTIFRLIYRVYPAHKMFLFLMEGLKSKNARQRTECLEELGNLIEMYGMPVCQPNPPTALKEVARQISDRDNSVRNAALNCIVNAFFLDGEKVYKYVGSISDKDMGLLEERIKRASKNRPPSGPPAPMVINQQMPKAQSPELNKAKPVANSRPPVVLAYEEQVTVVKRMSAGRPPVSRPVSGVFSLDLENVESKWGPEMPQLVQHDIDDILNEPIKLPESKMRPPTPASKILNNSHDAASAMDTVISHIASNDMKISIQALVQIDEFLKDEGRAEAMATRVDQLLVAASIQYRMTYTKHMGDEMTNRADIVPLYRCLTMALLSLFHYNFLAKRATKDVLKDLVYNLVTILLDTRLTDLKEGPDVIRTINVLVVKVIGKSDHTSMMSALIKLLHDCIANDNSSAKFTELIMKCLWKMIRLLQDIIHEMNLDRILLDLHQFLKAFPSSHWKGRTNDVPLRTVKTVLHTLAKLKGNKIMSHLTLIDNLQDSEIEPYLQKVLKGGVRHKTSAVIGEQNSATEQTGEHLSSRGKESRHSPRRLSKTTQEILADIFKKIGSKNKTKEGLADLYVFKKRYPEADIEPFLCKSSQFFQSYIERGLVNIELEHEGKGGPAGGQLLKHSLLSSSTGSIPSAMAGSMGGGTHSAAATTDANPSIYLERLKELKAKCGFTEYVTESGIVMTSKTSRATLSKAVSVSGNLESQTRCEEESTMRHESHHATTVYSVTHSNSSEGLSTLSAAGGPVEALRRRLERIKSATNP